MSSLTAPPALEFSRPKPGFIARNHFLFRRLHSLTGILFGLYLFVHLGINATLAEGTRHDGKPTVFQQQVDYIHSIPFLLVVECAFIYLPLAYHTLYGFWIIYTGQPNVGKYGYTRNWLYILQRISGLIIVLFAMFHIFTMKGWLPGEFARALEFDPLNATNSTARALYTAWWIWAVTYPIGILASAFHTVNGFYGAAVTWGLTISATAQKRWGVFCAILFFGLFGAGMTALVAGVAAAQRLPATSVPAHVALNSQHQYSSLLVRDSVVNQDSKNGQEQQTCDRRRWRAGRPVVCGEAGRGRRRRRPVQHGAGEAVTQRLRPRRHQRLQRHRASAGIQRVDALR
jgi:succinate dehydrogenase / fumarate reductase cytochrome b subunit